MIGCMGKTIAEAKYVSMEFRGQTETRWAGRPGFACSLVAQEIPIQFLRGSGSKSAAPPSPAMRIRCWKDGLAAVMGTRANASGAKGHQALLGQNPLPSSSTSRREQL